jgi:hypothetical protein
VILAAYLEPFAEGCGDGEVAAARLALATTWAEGGQYLLFGEDDGVLVHPYYPNYATLTDVAAVALRELSDFAVANGDLLFDPALLEATTHLVGGINGDVEISGAPISLRPTPGAVWVRAATRGRRIVLQLVDFRHQAGAGWNEVRQPPQPLDGVTIRVRCGSADSQVRFGQPTGSPHLVELPVSREGELVSFDLPELSTWGLCVIER